MSKENLATGLWNHLKGAYGKLERATYGHANAAIGSTIGGISGAVYGESGDDGSAGKSALGFIGGAAAGAALGVGAKYGLSKFKKAGAVADDLAKSEPTVAEEAVRIPDPMPVHTPTPEPVKPQNRTSEEIAKMDDADFDKWVRENLDSTHNAPPQPKPTQVKPTPVKKEESVAPKAPSSTGGNVPPKKKQYSFEEDMKEWQRKNPEYTKKLDEIYGGDLWQLGEKPEMGKTRLMKNWEKYEQPKKKKSMFDEDSPYRREYDGSSYNNKRKAMGNKYVKYTDPNAKVYPPEDYSGMTISNSKDLALYVNRPHEKVLNNLIPLKDTSYIGKEQRGKGEFYEPRKKNQRYTYQKSQETSPVDHKIKEVIGGEVLRTRRGEHGVKRGILDSGPGTIGIDLGWSDSNGHYHAEYDMAKLSHYIEKEDDIIWSKVQKSVDMEMDRYNKNSEFNGDTFVDSGAQEALSKRLRSRAGLRQNRGRNGEEYSRRSSNTGNDNYDRMKRKWDKYQDKKSKK